MPPSPLNRHINLYNQASSCYKNKEYNNAAKLLSDAISLIDEEIKNINNSGDNNNKTIEIFKGRLIHTLDLRSASNEQLNNLKSAIDDGKRCIKLQPSNPKGYLRVGKLLQLTNEDKDAYFTYSIGLKKVVMGQKTGDSNKEVSSKLIQLLADMKQQVAKRLKRQNTNDAQPPRKRFKTESITIDDDNKALKCMDPALFLPVEILFKIFGYLPQKYLFKSLLVSKIWYETIGIFPALIPKIELPLSKSSLKNVKLSLKSYKKLFQTPIFSKIILKELSLPLIKSGEDLPILKHLTLNSPVFIKKLIIRIDYPFLRFYELLSLKPKNHCLIGLKELKLTCPSTINDVEFLLILLPNLESLSLIMEQPENRKELRISSQCPIPSKTIYPNLKNISINLQYSTSGYYEQIIYYRSLPNIIKKLPNLLSLSIIGFEGLYEDINISLLDTIIKLKDLKTLCFEYHCNLNLSPLFSLNLLPISTTDNDENEEEGLLLKNLETMNIRSERPPKVTTSNTGSYTLNDAIKDFFKSILQIQNRQELEQQEQEEENIAITNLNNIRYPNWFETITFLDFSGTNINSKSLKSLFNLNTNTSTKFGLNLRKIRLHDCCSLIYQTSALQLRQGLDANNNNNNNISQVGRELSEYMEISLLFKNCPRLEELYLGRTSNLNDYSLELLYEYMKETSINHDNKNIENTIENESYFHLKVLDLSLNNSITGYGLLKLFDFVPSSTTTSKAVRKIPLVSSSESNPKPRNRFKFKSSSSKAKGKEKEKSEKEEEEIITKNVIDIGPIPKRKLFTVDTLILDGCDNIALDTIAFLKNPLKTKGIIDKVRYVTPKRL